MAEVIDKKYKCGVCSKTFTKSHTVKVHMRIHTGHRPHECLVCSKSFVTSSALKDHLISHVSSRDYMCTRCDARFKHKGTLKRHQLQHEEYERKRDNQENNAITVYEHQMAFDLPDTKYFEISAGEAQQKFPEIQEFFNSQSGGETSSHTVVVEENCHATVVKQEKLLEEDTPYGAAILELTEDKFYDKKGMSVRVYNISGEVENIATEKLYPKEPKMYQPTTPVYRPRPLTAPSFGVESQVLDIPSGYGLHVSRILSLLKYSPDKQVALIHKLNKTIHGFVVRSRK
ncbi:zinc finger protein 394-like [Palaemon carinicauda]|uniref:zinc finger protein 394-like n=1 Tax=Palaemon carinicauda TaxID=392227 RepID=UPI0035B684E4